MGDFLDEMGSDQVCANEIYMFDGISSKFQPQVVRVGVVWISDVSLDPPSRAVDILCLPHDVMSKFSAAIRSTSASADVDICFYLAPAGSSSSS
jgi:hypothetical protein